MTYENRPLVQGLLQFKESVPLSLHVPGHKGGLLSGLPTDLRSALSYDVTELEGLDDLHEATGIIREAEQKLTALYGADRSYFLVNGSTVGNLSMVYAVCQQGDTVIVQRNAHKSIFHALELTGARPVFITPDWNSETYAAGVVTVEGITAALKAYPETKAVVLTYPTYYGDTGEELEKIIQLCHEREVPVLVDEAHGAHFVVGEPFPRSALEMGADIVVHSAHKTLPAMTMASFLHIRSTLVTQEQVGHYLQMLQSSSPSYLLMASLDDARAYAESYDEKDKISFMVQRKAFITELNKIQHVQAVEVDDPLKLIVRVEGMSGFDLQKALDARGIFVELADPYQVLFVLPLLKKEQHFPFGEIMEGMTSVAEQANGRNAEGNINHVPMSGAVVSELYYTANELKRLRAEWISYKQAVGKVAAASVVPYPPGIPLLLAGEMVTEPHVRSLETLLAMGANFQGAIQIEKKQILVVMDEVEE